MWLTIGVGSFDVIETVAGGGTMDGPATSAFMSWPHATFVLPTHANGNATSPVTLYIADRLTSRIRRVNETGMMSSIAGSGAVAYGGNGGPARSAALNQPNHVIALRAANVNDSDSVILFIADSGNHCVRRVDANGIISTFAGSAAAGFSGDNGPAVAARFNYPTGLAAVVGPNGSGIEGLDALYIADFKNHRIRRINSSGIVGTVAGNGSPGFSGDFGHATQAKLNFPSNVFVLCRTNSSVPGCFVWLFIADQNNHRIRAVNDQGVIWTVAGDGSLSTLQNPWGIHGYAERGDFGNDSSVVLFVTDSGNNRIVRLSLDGNVTTVAGTGVAEFSGDGGDALAAGLNYPVNVFVHRTSATNEVDKLTTLYVTDRSNNKIRRIDETGHIWTVAGTNSNSFGGDGGPATSAMLSGPFIEALETDNCTSHDKKCVMLYIADSNSQRIRRVDDAGIITTVAGTGDPGHSGDGGPATKAMLQNPSGVSAALSRAPQAQRSHVLIFIADSGNHRVRCATDGGVIVTVAGTGLAGNTGDGGLATAARLNQPLSVAAVVYAQHANCTQNVTLFIADHGNHRIRRVEPDGKISTIAGKGTSGFSGDGGLATAAQLNRPAFVCALVRPALNLTNFERNVTLYIADGYNHRIRKVDEYGNISTVAGSGALGSGGDGGPATAAAMKWPWGVHAIYHNGSTVNDSAVTVFIGDASNHRVRRVDPEGFMWNVAGSGAGGFNGDGLPLATTRLYKPHNMVAIVNTWRDAADETVTLFIADSLNNRIRKVSAYTPSTAPSASPSQSPSSTSTITTTASCTTSPSQAPTDSHSSSPTSERASIRATPYPSASTSPQSPADKCQEAGLASDCDVVIVEISM
ncbi:MAG: hypothetical protein EOO65_00845 [Methanosarcinales archaeon]|nr:MAG: hypothetical protein EOO65_00845 [Methanosarcinales archaeon]